MDTISRSMKLQGLRAARHLARRGRFVFAVKCLERANPGISRMDAKSIVASFTYGDQPEPLELFDQRPIRIL
jgi:hypothetical protein